ncbi:DUF4062 domain-containing protein [Desulfolutivibrio sulfoxidireducens]|uniref:DUF4062 domain-containing protein n=1 Tax=Desulfolutivibrio sulfoxidireducens TaxID=2773299 RepID=UPI00159DA9D7|nr:DUF4062 domain-containing protein [Desulfolutivibrio sulfoxidireducens]QLA15205.1 DUF4062 domain-containing protein [Desulfolutivibrio sulfoxidireducens]
MPYQATVYKIMITSPSDLGPERGIIREVIHEWNAINSEARKIVILPIAWETHSAPSMDDKAQNIINKTLLRDCDLLVGVFWTRIGTKTDRYESGSVEEIENHISSTKPTMLYFSAAPVIMDSVDQEQYSRLSEFKAKCKDRGLFETYSDLMDFKNKFSRQLQIEFNKQNYLKNNETSSNQTQDVLLKVNGGLLISKEAQHILKETSQDQHGRLYYLRYIGGETIQTNNKTLFEGNDPRQAASFDGAIAELEQAGLFKAEGAKREVFSITRAGYSMADILK